MKKIFFLLSALMFFLCSCQINTQTKPAFFNPTELTYEVHFHPNGVTGDEIIQKMNLGSANQLEPLQYNAPVGMRFGGWNTKPDGSGDYYNDCQKFTIGSSNVNLYAIWIDKDAHAIHYFNLNGAENPNSLSYFESKTITLNEPIRNGYKFDGWFDNSSLTGTKITGWNTGTYDSDISLYAKWTLVTYSITYNLDGGTLTNSNPATYTIESDTITLNNPTKTEHTFSGWYNGSTKVTTILNGSTGNLNLTAKWLPVVYSVKFYNDDGTSLLKEIDVISSESFIIDSSYFNVTGRRALRWYLNKNGTGNSYVSGTKFDNCKQDYTFYSYSTENMNGIIVSASDLEAVLSKLPTGQTYDIIIADSLPSEYSIQNALKNYPDVNVNINLGYTNMTYISNFAENCPNVIDIVIPASVKNISLYAFSGCKNLQNVYYQGTLEQWLEINFSSLSSNPMYYAKHLFIDGKEISGEITIPEEITKLNNYCLAYCNITSVNLPSTLTAIGTYAFAYTNLQSINIPDSVSSLGKGFIYQTFVEEVRLPAGFTSIPEELFPYSNSGSISIKKIIIPSTVTQIKGTALYGCANMESVIFEDPYGWVIDYVDNPYADLYYKKGDALTLTDPSDNAFRFKALNYSYDSNGKINGWTMNGGKKENGGLGQYTYDTYILKKQ